MHKDPLSHFWKADTWSVKIATKKDEKGSNLLVVGFGKKWNHANVTFVLRKEFCEKGFTKPSFNRIRNNAGQGGSPQMSSDFKPHKRDSIYPSDEDPTIITVRQPKKRSIDMLNPRPRVTVRADFGITWQHAAKFQVIGKAPLLC